MESAQLPNRVLFVQSRNIKTFVWNALILCSLYALSIVGSQADEAMKIPDPSRDRAFLYCEWRPNPANVVAFIDPLCPYCKKANPKFDQVTDYNLFAYWAPIFGQRSNDIISLFFQCEQPTGRAIPIGLLATAVSPATTVPAACDSDESDPNFSDARQAANDAIVPSYAFGVVPAFFLQGVQTSLSQIQSIPVGPARYINGVAIAWQRDKESKVDQNGPSGSFAIIFPKHQNSRSNFQLVERYRPEYFFMLNDWQALCEALSAAACANGEDIQRTRLQHCNEIVASLGLDNQSGETFLLTSEVRLNSVNTNDLSGVD